MKIPSAFPDTASSSLIPSSPRRRASVFPVSYAFFLEQYKTIGIQPAIRISEHLSFSSRMLLAFGVTFEMPMVTFFLARMAAVTHRTMLGYLRYAILGIFIVAAVLTPGPNIAS